MTSKTQKNGGWILPAELTGYDLLCVQLKIPDEIHYRAAFSAALQSLCYWWNWEHTYTHGDTRGGQAAMYWRDIIDTYLCVENDPGSNGLGCGCGCKKPTNQRYTADGILEQSFDGGTTWERDTSDPRFNSPLYPPMSGSDGTDKRCLAAASAAKYIDREIVQKMNETDAAADLLLLIAAAVAILITGFTAAPLVIALISQVIAFGVDATKAAFTSGVWDTFRCILYCNMNDDGSFTEAQWQEIKTEIFDQLGSSIAGTFLRDTVNAFGPAGLTNAGRSGSATTADCSDCTDCPTEWCHYFDFEVSDGGFAGPYGTYAPGVGWQATSAGTGVSTVLDRTVSTSDFTYAKQWVEASGTCNVVTFVGGSVLQNADNVPTGEYDGFADITGTLLRMNTSSGAAQGSNVTIKALMVMGTGVNPFGSDNCP